MRPKLLFAVFVATLLAPLPVPRFPRKQKAAEVLPEMPTAFGLQLDRRPVIRPKRIERRTTENLYVAYSTTPVL